MSDPVTLVQPAATRVRDPVSKRSVWLARVLRHPRMEDGRLVVDLVFGPDHAEPDRLRLADEIEAALREEGVGVPIATRFCATDAPRPTRRAERDPVQGMQGAEINPHGGPVMHMSLPDIAHIVAVASGKGGVGKSTVATNLAVGLALRGHRVGLLDADAYGPSLHLMMGTDARPMVDQNRRITPITVHGVRCLSMGMLTDPRQAIIWRGPMVMSLVRQFLRDTDWGELDHLVVDLPPGTGDAQLTLVQAVDLSGAVIVTTPQQVALADAVRGIEMFRQLEVPILGLVENMAYYELPDGRRDHVFGQDGGKKTARLYGMELLAEVPLRSALCAAGDAGRPVVLDDEPVGQAFRDLAKRVAVKLPVPIDA